MSWAYLIGDWQQVGLNFPHSLLGWTLGGGHWGRGRGFTPFVSQVPWERPALLSKALGLFVMLETHGTVSLKGWVIFHTSDRIFLEATSCDLDSECFYLLPRVFQVAGNPPSLGFWRKQTVELQCTPSAMYLLYSSGNYIFLLQSTTGTK